MTMTEGTKSSPGYGKMVRTWFTHERYNPEYHCALCGEKSMDWFHLYNYHEQQLTLWV